MSEKEILEEIILGYRNLINERYQYQNLQDKYNLPKTINEEIVISIKNYFLTYLYPDLDKRRELNEAFETLDDYVKHPEKLLSILMESVKLIFSHGRHLPKILNAGLKALKSFRRATKFEQNLVKLAIQKQIHPPYDRSKIYSLIELLSPKEIEQFFENTESLFKIMHDKTLVEKIKEVLMFLINKMKEKKKLYSQSEIRGLEIGLEMIVKGEALFDKLTKEDQDKLVQFIVKVERDNLNEIF